MISTSATADFQILKSVIERTFKNKVELYIIKHIAFVSYLYVVWQISYVGFPRHHISCSGFPRHHICCLGFPRYHVFTYNSEVAINRSLF